MHHKNESGPNGVRADNQEISKAYCSNASHIGQIYDALSQVTLDPYMDIEDQEAHGVVECLANQLDNWQGAGLEQHDHFQFLEPLVRFVDRDLLVALISEVDRDFATRFDAFLYGVEL